MSEKKSDLPLVITMNETYGSNMEPVSARVGEILGVPVHTQAFSSEDIEQMVAEDRTGQVAKLARRLSTGAIPAVVGEVEIAAVGTALAREWSDYVTEKAETGGVIEGRISAFILRDRPNTLHILLDGKAEKRVERAAKLDRIPLSRAAKRQRLEDRIRVENGLLAFGCDTRDIELYDVILNTTFQETEETAQVIAALARVRVP